MQVPKKPDDKGGGVTNTYNERLCLSKEFGWHRGVLLRPYELVLVLIYRDFLFKKYMYKDIKKHPKYEEYLVQLKLWQKSDTESSLYMKAKNDVVSIIKNYFDKAKKDDFILSFNEKSKKSEIVKLNSIKKLKEIYKDFFAKYKEYTKNESGSDSYKEQLSVLNERFIIAIEEPTYNNILYLFKGDISNSIIGFHNSITYETIVSVEMVQEVSELILSKNELKIYNSNNSIKELFGSSVSLDEYSYQDKIYEKIWFILYLVIHTEPQNVTEVVIWAKDIVMEIERLTSKNIASFGMIAEYVHLFEGSTMDRWEYNTDWYSINKVKDISHDYELLHDITRLNVSIDLLKLELQIVKANKNIFSKVLDLFK